MKRTWEEICKECTEEATVENRRPYFIAACFDFILDNNLTHEEHRILGHKVQEIILNRAAHAAVTETAAPHSHHEAAYQTPA